MKLSEHFARKEFTCPCGCGYDTADKELVDLLEDIRKHYNKPVIITSGARCVKHNSEIGGAVHSRHLLGQAADFRVKNIRADNAADYLIMKYPDRYGIGRYIGRTHVDVRIKKARWDKR